MEERAHQESLIMSREEKNLISPSFNLNRTPASYNRSKTDKEREVSKTTEIKPSKSTVGKIQETKNSDSKCSKS